ncbi:MAG: hypothetical protein CYPHOPRED_003210 [Cyphobasidiales sp. Tagirdzhanova-0007]|nr:MAG: hypothetical protein CYPHOPRED_003210 [Cyphobasidiales sp. Tagirdzhanova-0007]
MAVPPALTKEGYEIHFGTNHLGHALLIRLLLPIIQKTPDGRVISITSTAHFYPPSEGIPFETLKTTRSSGLGAPGYNYSISKLANVLYVQELARRNPTITFIAVHPGTVATALIASQTLAMRIIIRLTNPMGYLSPEQGAHSQLWAATTQLKNLTNGAYYEPVGEKGRETKHTKDKQLAKKLFDYTELELHPYL